MVNPYTVIGPLEEGEGVAVPMAANAFAGGTLPKSQFSGLNQSLFGLGFAGVW
jgi:hypothetical protein